MNNKNPDPHLEMLKKKFPGKWRLAGSQNHLKYIIDLGKSPSTERIIYDADTKKFTYFMNNMNNDGISWISWNRSFGSEINQKEVNLKIKLSTTLKNFK